MAQKIDPFTEMQRFSLISPCKKRASSSPVENVYKHAKPAIIQFHIKIDQNSFKKFKTKTMI